MTTVWKQPATAELGRRFGVGLGVGAVGGWEVERLGGRGLGGGGFRKC